MLWTLLLGLFVLWLLGVIGHVGTVIVHVVLAVALFLFLVQLLGGRRMA